MARWLQHYVIRVIEWQEWSNGDARDACGPKQGDQGGQSKVVARQMCSVMSMGIVPIITSTTVQPRQGTIFECFNVHQGKHHKDRIR